MCFSSPTPEHAVICDIAVLSFQTMTHMHTVLHCIAWMSVRREVYPFASLQMCAAEEKGSARDESDPWRGFVSCHY
jgi:hypothetical protein